MSLIIQISEGVKRVMYTAKHPVSVLRPSSQICVCTMCVFINKAHVQKWEVGGGGGGGEPIGWPTDFKKWVGNCPPPHPLPVPTPMRSCVRASTFVRARVRP